MKRIAIVALFGLVLFSIISEISAGSRRERRKAEAAQKKGAGYHVGGLASENIKEGLGNLEDGLKNAGAGTVNTIAENISDAVSEAKPYVQAAAVTATAVAAAYYGYKYVNPGPEEQAAAEEALARKEEASARRAFIKAQEGFARCIKEYRTSVIGMYGIPKPCEEQAADLIARGGKDQVDMTAAYFRQ